MRIYWYTNSSYTQCHDVCTKGCAAKGYTCIHLIAATRTTLTPVLLSELDSSSFFHFSNDNLGSYSQFEPFTLAIAQFSLTSRSSFSLRAKARLDSCNTALGGFACPNPKAGQTFLGVSPGPGAIAFLPSADVRPLLHMCLELSLSMQQELKNTISYDRVLLLCRIIMFYDRSFTVLTSLVPLQNPF